MDWGTLSCIKSTYRRKSRMDGGSSICCDPLVDAKHEFVDDFLKSIAIFNNFSIILIITRFRALRLSDHLFYLQKRKFCDALASPAFLIIWTGLTTPFVTSFIPNSSSCQEEIYATGSLGVVSRIVYTHHDGIVLYAIIYVMSN